MNRDYYSNQNWNSDEMDSIQNAQFDPRRPPGRPPGGQQPEIPPRGQQPGRPPGGQQPGRPPGNQPNTAPPNYTPRLPSMGNSGPAQFGVDGRSTGARGFFWPPQDMRRCLNRFTFIWLINGNSFWFFPIDVRGQFIEGFRWRRNRWEFDRINRNRMLFHSCN